MTGKKRGGQPGHKGTTLKQFAQPTQTVTHALPAQCDRCQQPLAQEDASIAERRQVIEVPKMTYDVIEHHTLSLVCQCGQQHASVFPVGVNEAVQCGPNLRALGVHLTQGQLLPFERSQQTTLVTYRIGYVVLLTLLNGIVIPQKIPSYHFTNIVDVIPDHAEERA